MVLIGIDPHKATHIAVAVDTEETALAELTVKADRHQVERLLKWAIDFPDRRWAVESANGLGFLLEAQRIGDSPRDQRLRQSISLAMSSKATARAN